jgi:hypothetical protein
MGPREGFVLTRQGLGHLVEVRCQLRELIRAGRVRVDAEVPGGNPVGGQRQAL